MCTVRDVIYLCMQFVCIRKLPKKESKAITTVDVDKPIYERLSKKAKEKGYSSVTRFVNDLLLMNVEKDELLQKYGPSFFAQVFDDSVMVKGPDDDVTAEVKLRDGNLICLKDESDNCKHVLFAWAIPEICKLNIKRPK